MTIIVVEWYKEYFFKRGQLFTSVQLMRSSQMEISKEHGLTTDLLRKRMSPLNK